MYNKLLLVIIFIILLNCPLQVGFSQELGEDREFIFKYMGLLPGESDIVSYSKYDYYYDAYVKFLLFGSEKGDIPGNIRIFSKSGLAYGYALDNAYIVDFENTSYLYKDLPSKLNLFHLGLASYQLSPATDYMLPVKMRYNPTGSHTTTAPPIGIRAKINVRTPPSTEYEIPKAQKISP